MATRFEPSDVRKQWQDNFGTDCPTVQQAWFLTKLAKHVRLRCRNNSAFNNFMNAAFGNGLIFKEAVKTNQYGEEYDGLEISPKQLTPEQILNNLAMISELHKLATPYVFTGANGNRAGILHLTSIQASEYASALAKLWGCEITIGYM